MQAPRGFAVRVFKGPTLSSFPYTATAKFDVGYRPSIPNDPRQAQNWYCPREPARQPVSNSREPPKASRFGSWTENRGRDTPRPSAALNYADFIYERSLSSKSDIYSDNDTSSTITFTSSSIFSPPLPADSPLTSAPSEVPYQSPTTSNSTITSSPRHPFPLHIPALTQAQSAIRGLFVHPNGDNGQSNTSPTPIPAAPPGRSADLPDVAGSPPRFLASDAPTSPMRIPLSESPQPISYMASSDYFARPVSESEAGEAQRLAERNAQYNSASSAYYQAGLPSADNQQNRDGGMYYDARSVGREQSPEHLAQMGSTLRSLASSSFPTDSNDSQGRGVYESSSLATETHTFYSTTETNTARPAPPGVTYVSSESSTTTAVESEPRWRDSYALNAQNVPVSQLVQLDSPIAAAGDRLRTERSRVLSDSATYEELRGLNMLSDRQRDTFVNAFAQGTHSRAAPHRSSPSAHPQVPAVVRSDSGSSPRVPPAEERPRRLSGNLWSSLPQIPGRRSPSQAPARPSSTPPLPRIDTSRLSAPPPPPPAERTSRAPDGPPYQQSPPRRDQPTAQQQPSTAAPVNSNRSRTPVAGPRVLPPEPLRRRSDGDQPISSSPSLLKRTSAIFHKSPVPEAPAPRPSRPGALPLDPQRRRSDGFNSVVPPRPTTPVQTPGPPRNVRWNENLVCPSPIFASQRRKGWFNRRGYVLSSFDRCVC